MTESDLSLPPVDKLHAAVANAIKFFAASREPYALLWLDVMHRRFGISEFADALKRYDQVMSEQPDQAPLRAVLRRIADRDNPVQPEDWEAVSLSSDRILVSALYCDRLGLPPSFAEVLHKAAKAGGYYLTHVLLAWIWIEENGCALTLPDGFIDDVYTATSAIIYEDPLTLTGLRIEAAAFLYLAGQGARVDGVFVERIIVEQNDDGGWGESSSGQGGSDWHSTIVGLLLLLHVKFIAETGETAGIGLGPTLPVSGIALHPS